MSTAKDSKEAAKKPSSEAKRILQTDQEKQRKEKIKTCIGEIAKELPLCSDHVDRKPSTLSIVSQAKEYIKKLKEQNQAYENNLVAEQQQEELKRLREQQTEHLEKIKKLEETLKTYEKVNKPRSNDDSGSAAHPDRDSPTGRRRPKTINKLLEKERSDQLLTTHSDIHHLDETLLIGSNFGHHGNSSAIGSGGSNNSSTLPPSSLVLPMPSSGISIMTVAPTILSVKSPSLGQTRNQQTSRSISTASVVGSGTSSRISSSASSSLVSYLDVMGSDFSDSANGIGSSVIDSSQTNLVYSTSSMSASAAVLAAGGGSVVNTADVIGLQQLQNNSVAGSNSGGGGGGSSLIGGIQNAELSLIHHHQQQQQQNMAPLLNISQQQQEGPGSASALQTLASVATSSHMAGLGSVSLANSQQVGATGPVMGLSMGLGGGLSAMSLGQLQGPNMSLAQSELGAALAQDRKQVFFNGQILTLTDHGLISSHQQVDTECQNSLQASICPQSSLPMGAGSSLHQAGINVGGILGQGNFSGAQIGSGPLAAAAGSGQPSIIYTINEHGHLVPLQTPMNHIQPGPSGLDFMAGAGGNIMTNFQNPSAGNAALIPSSVQHQQQSSFLAQPPIMSIAGGHGSSQPFTILPPTPANPLQPQMISGGSFLMAQQFPQQQQVLNLSGLGGLQVVNPFTGMLVNNLGTTLSGATVKLVGNELKIIQPGDSSSGAQGPTHVMVDGSLIPISTNPQTIVPSAASISTIGQKTHPVSLANNPILQFDPINPNAPPILFNGSATCPQMGPQMLGPGPLYSPALSGTPGILHMASGGPLGSSIPFQLGSSSGVAVASTMVAGTVTTNSVSACISSPSVSTATTKGGKGLPTLAPALSQASPVIGSSVANSYQTILPSGLPQQFVINGQKVVSSKQTAASAVIPKPASHNRKRSPSTARASPIVASDVAVSQYVQQQHLLPAATTAAVQTSVKYATGAEKASKSKSSKHGGLQQQEDKRGLSQKTDLLAQATATAGILMDGEVGNSDYSHQANSTGESGNLNISTGSNANLSGSSSELQINLKQSPRDEEDDNVQLIIDENCVSGVSSTSPAHSSFSPNMLLSSALSANTSSSVFNQDMSLSSGTAQQHLHIQPPNGGDLTTPLVSPNIPSMAGVSHNQRQSTTAAMLNMASQLHSPLPSNIFSTSSTSGILNPSANSELQIVAGPFRPEDVFAQLSSAMSTDSKINISPDSSNKLNTLTSFSVSTSLPLSLTSTSPVPKLYIPIAPAPVKVSTISTAMSLAHDAPSFSFTDSVGSATVLSDKQASKGKCRSKKQAPLPVTVASLQLKNMDVSICGLQAFQAEPKKKPPPRKRKTKAELKLEKEEKERLAKEEEEKKEENEIQEKRLQEMEHKVKQNSCRGGDDDNLLPVLEMNDNEAVKEQILHSVSESKLLNTDGSQISLMDMVDKIEIFNSAVGNSDVFCSGGAASEIPVEGVKPNKLSTILPEKGEQDKSAKRESTRKRTTDPCGNNAPKADNKRTKKTKAIEPLKSVDGVLFNVNSAVSGSSDIYDFVDDEDGGNQFIQPPATPTKLTSRKPPVSRKGKGSKPTSDPAPLAEARPSCSVAARGDAKPASRTVNPGRQLMEPTLDHVALSKLSTVVAASATPCTSVSLSSPSSSSLLTMPKSPLFASTPAKPSPGSLTTSNSITISNTACAMDSNRTVGTVNNANTSNSCMSKKDGPDTALQSTLEESFSMEFPVMDFQTSPKLSETQDDHENSMGLPAETLADLFTQHSPGKIMLTSSPPLLQNGVLSPSDVELPALRTPAPLMNHNHSEPVLLLDNRVNKDLISPSSSSKQTLSHMHTPPHPDPKSPVISLVDISTASSSSSTSLSLTTTASSMPPLSVSLSMSSGNSVGSCNNSSTTLHHHLDAAVSPRSASQLDSQMPSLSSSSLDALSEILPLKPITAELEAEDSMNSSCAQQQRRSTPVQGHSLSHGALTSADVGMGVSQQQQQSMMSDLQQKSQQSRQNQPHHPPQSSPHNLRPPSASTTPLPSPKLHASPGSASNAGSVHSMSPAAQQQQQQQQHLSCQKQQNSQMGSTSMMDRVSTAPLSHPPSQTQLFNPDTSPRNTTFASPPSGSSMKLKHMSPSNSQPNTEQNFGSQKGGSFPPGTGQQTKNQYSVDKIIEHPNSGSAGVSARHPSDSFNFTNIGSNVATSTSAPSSGPLTSNQGGSGFTFSLSATNQQHQQQSSCSANSSAVSALQPTLPPGGAHASHNSPYLNSFFPPPLPMNPPSASTSSSHHSLSMHPQGNMEIQHTTSRPSSGGSSTSAYGMGTSSLMTYGNQPKLDIPPIAKSPTYNTNNPSSNNSSTNNASNNTVPTGKSPSSGSGSGVSGSYSHSSSKQAIDSSASRYQASKSTAESIYQQQQKRPNTIQHPPAGMSHMDSMARLSSSAHNNGFFTMGFPTSSTASLSSASMPLRHLPDTRDISSRSPYDYAPVPHHPAMGFPHPHSQIPSGYGTHASFARDCARLESSHHQTQQQAQQHQQQQQSPRKQTTPKKSSSSASIGSSANATSSNSGNNSSNTSSHRGSGSSGSSGSSSLNQDHGHSPAASSSRTTPSQHHSSQQQNAGTGSTNSSSHNRSSNSQKRKAASSSSSSKKKSTASQHTGFPMDPMDTSMSQNMFEPSFPYLNFPTLAQSMSPPAARPHQADTPFLSGMFNTQPRPISNSSAKTADMTASHFPLFSARAQNSFFQPTGFGMNSVTGNHGNPTAGISPHSMAVPPHMSAFGLFGNEATGAPDNISSNKFLHTNSILPGGHQAMDHSLQHGHQASLYHTRPHSAQSHMMAAFYPHGFDTRSHMGQPFNSSMGPPPFHTSGLPPINFSMHDSH